MIAEATQVATEPAKATQTLVVIAQLSRAVTIVSEATQTRTDVLQTGADE